MMLGTEPTLPRLVEDFLRQEVEACDVCRRAAGWLDDPLARDVVVAFAGIHDRDVVQLRQLAGVCGAHPPDGGGGDHTARTLGHLELAHAREGDGALLEVVAQLETEVLAGYERVLANTTLPEDLRPLFEEVRDELRRRGERLSAARRIAA
ncbi:MAG: hypothetical protein GVY33_04755 [Alphaproteobacteria bacterium]|jgi:hypothetical protein|nr:hypothetical protein [Alphaproteobacteria bacterium]